MWRKCMLMTIRPVSTIKFIGLSETNTIGYVSSLPSSRVVHTCIALCTKRAMHEYMYSAMHEYMLSYVGIAILLPYLAKQRDDGPLPRPEFLIGSLPKGIDFGFL